MQHHKLRRVVVPGAIALLVGTAVVAASAATLGGLTGDDLGADDAAVASCDTDGLTVDYTTSYDATDQRYEVTAVVLSGIATACAAQTASVTLADSTGAAVGSGSATIGGTSATVTLSTAASAEAVEHASVLITN